MQCLVPAWVLDPTVSRARPALRCGVTMLQPTIWAAAARPARPSIAALTALLLAVSGVAQVLVPRVSAPPDGDYDRTMALHFTASFSSPVVVRGSPRLVLRVGGSIRHATWTPPLGLPAAMTSLTFVYHPDPLDETADGIVVAPELDLNGGEIQGVDTSAVQLSFAAPDTRGVRVRLRPPPTPRILGLTSGRETMPGAMAAGNDFVLRGTADAGSRVTVSLVDGEVVGATTAVANGAWSVAYPPALLGAGTYRLTAMAQNSAGLISAPSARLELNVSPGPDDPTQR